MIKPIIEEKKSTIFLPKSQKEIFPNKGEVIMVGKNVKEIKTGEVIMFNQDKTSEFKIGKKRYLVIEEDEVYLKKIGRAHV